jgi:hypothetical protein
VVASPSAEILRVTRREKAHLIVMDTHGQVCGLGAGRQRGAAGDPVLLVK